jgi:hypothetical protein
MRYLLSTILLVLLFSNSSTAQDQPTTIDKITRFQIKTLCEAKGYKYDYDDDRHRIWVRDVVIHAYITDNDNLSLETNIMEEAKLTEVNSFNKRQDYVTALKFMDETTITSTIICKGVTFNHINLLLRLQAKFAHKFVNNYID